MQLKSPWSYLPDSSGKQAPDIALQWFQGYDEMYYLIQSFSLEQWTIANYWIILTNGPHVM